MNACSVFLLVAALVLAGCGTTAPQTVVSPPAIPSAMAVTVQIENSAWTGTMRAAGRTVVAANTAGRITTLAVEPGQRVTVGEVLATLDTGPAEDRLAVAEADCARVRATLAQAEQRERMLAALVQAGRVPTLDASAALAEVEAQRAALTAAIRNRDLAQRDIAEHCLIARRAGVVAERRCQPGDVVAPGQAVLALDDDGPVRATLMVPGSETSHWTVGAEVVIDGSAHGRVLTVGNGGVGDLMPVVIESAESGLRPGRTVRVRPATTLTAVAVPLGALQWGDTAGTATVWIAVAGHAQPRTVQVLPRPGTHAFISDGLAAGERVLLPGATTIIPGQTVE